MAELDAQSGNVGTTGAVRSKSRSWGGEQGEIYGAGQVAETVGYSDSGGASRFFPSFRYQAKAPASERPKIDGKGWPTVKPQGVMRWLVRLLVPSGGTVLDPFAGTAATLQAARDEGFASLGIERDEFAYLLACQRLGLPEVVPAAVVDADTGGPVSLVEHVPSIDPVLVAIASASSYAELTAIWREHKAEWSQEHTDAATARRAELGEAAA